MTRAPIAALAAGAAVLLGACGSGGGPSPSPSASASASASVAIGTPSPSPSPSAAATSTGTPSACLASGTPPPSNGPASGDDEAGPSIAVVGAQQVWVPGRGGHILHSADAGATWVRQGTGAHQVHQVDMVDSLHGLAVAADALLRTADGGACWTAAAEPPQPLTEVHMISAQSGWGVKGGGGGGGVGLGGVLVHTDDDGASWQPVAGAPQDAQSACFVDAQHGWLGAGGTVQRSSDGGRTWSAVLYTAPRGQATVVLECSAPGTVAVLSLSLQGAAGNQPYGAYWSGDGTHFAKVFDDMYSQSDASPPPGSAPTAAPESGSRTAPGSYPGPFSIVDASATVWSGHTPALTDRPVGVVLSRGAQTAGGGRPTLAGDVAPAGIAFTDAQHGYLAVLTHTGSSATLTVLATGDGGSTWQTLTTD